MRYPDYFFSLSTEQQAQYARRADTTRPYLRTHVFCPINRRKVPRPETMERLADATEGACNMDDVIDYIYKCRGARC